MPRSGRSIRSLDEQERGSGPPRSTASNRPASVGLDLPEAIRAIDRSIHARLERNLCLVATRRADHGEILARHMVVSALIAARTADVTDVVARLTTGPPAGSTAGASLRVRSEALLDVILLVGGRMDEFHTAVDTCQRSVDVGHENVPLLWHDRGPGHSGRPLRQTGRCGCVGRSGAATQVPLWSPCFGRTGWSMAAPYTDGLKPALHSSGRRLHARGELQLTMCGTQHTRNPQRSGRPANDWQL
jgi:hypothetical protein